MDPGLYPAANALSKKVSSSTSSSNSNSRQISNGSHESSSSTAPIVHTPETGTITKLLSSGEGWESPVSVEGKAPPDGDVKLAPLPIGDTFDESDAPPTKKLKTNKEVKTCKQEGCTNQARRAGLCWTHGAKQECRYEGCTNVVVKGGVCVKHGAKVTYALCSKEGCTKYAQKGGLCISHGSPVKTCRYEGCTKYAQKGGVCIRHGAKVKQCQYEGCTSNARKAGLCAKHGKEDAEKKLSAAQRT